MGEWIPADKILSLCCGVIKQKEVVLNGPSARVNAIRETTSWFDAKLHSPARDGWYEFKECNSRHLIKNGLWYRNKKSFPLWNMTIYKCTGEVL
jgi:hypothetical protein